MAENITKQDVVDFISGMTVLELSEFVKELGREIRRHRSGADGHMGPARSGSARRKKRRKRRNLTSS